LSQEAGTESKEPDMTATQTPKTIKVQAGTTEKIHYSTRLVGRNRRPVCGTSSRSANFTEITNPAAHVNCEKCLAA
jgi:tetrahydromethanopterin S-methyltransferase subunit F